MAFAKIRRKIRAFIWWVGKGNGYLEVGALGGDIYEPKLLSTNSSLSCGRHLTSIAADSVRNISSSFFPNIYIKNKIYNYNILDTQNN